MQTNTIIKVAKIQQLGTSCTQNTTRIRRPEGRQEILTPTEDSLWSADEEEEESGVTCTTDRPPRNSASIRRIASPPATISTGCL